jgi:SAM-dependent methyltransferase
MTPDPRTMRGTFDAVADLYDRARPTYPPEMFDDLAGAAGLVPGSRVLEIACGTGQATLPLAERGYAVEAVELGAALATLARRNLAAHPRVRVSVSSFEEWPLPPEPFDVVLCATAFHWIDPAVRLAKSARALRAGGWLAVVDTVHVDGGGTRQLFVDAQACYLEFDPDTAPGFRLPTVQDVPVERDDLLDAGLFEPPVLHRYLREVSYSTQAYLDVLRTYSSVRRLPPQDQDGLLACLGDLIDTRYAGRLDMVYLTELRLARRR